MEKTNETKEDRKYALIATRMLEEKDFGKIPDGIKDLVSYYKGDLETSIKKTKEELDSWMEKAGTDLHDIFVMSIGSDDWKEKLKSSSEHVRVGGHFLQIYGDIVNKKLKCFNNIIEWIKSNPEKVEAFTELKE